MPLGSLKVKTKKVFGRKVQKLFWVSLEEGKSRGHLYQIDERSSTPGSCNEPGCKSSPTTDQRKKFSFGTKVVELRFRFTIHVEEVREDVLYVQYRLSTAFQQ